MRTNSPQGPQRARTDLHCQCTRRDDACRYDSDPVKTSGQRLVGMSEHLRFGRTPLWAVSTDAEERKRRRSTKIAEGYVQVGLRCAPRLAYKPV